MDSADALASILINQSGDDRLKVQTAYQRVLGRPATDSETQRVLAFVAAFEPEKFAAEKAVAAQGSATAAAASKTLQAWSMVCQSLFASNEFSYVR
jgi:hypothetical protein